MTGPETGPHRSKATETTSTLEQLLADAKDADGLTRIDYRDPIAAYGVEAVTLLEPWIEDPRLGVFAVLTIKKAGTEGARTAAITALRRAVGHAGSPVIAGDVAAALAQLGFGARARTIQVSRPPRPVDTADYVPPLTQGEQRLRAYFRECLPGDWEIYLRPHLDGDRPTLALLHPTNGAMIWEVKEWPLSSFGREADRWLDGRTDPPRQLVDPLAHVNQVRNRIYRELLPSLGEAIDTNSARYGIVKVGLFFAQGSRQDIERLGLSPSLSAQVTCAAEELVRPNLGYLVANLHRAVDLDAETYQALQRLIGRYHRPTVSRLKMTSRQRELVAQPQRRRWQLRGVAGSGKSLVVVNRAAALASQGKRVLVLGFNITLANYLRELREAAPYRFEQTNLTVRHFHDLCSLVLRTTHTPGPRAPEWDGQESEEGLEAREQDYYDDVLPKAAEGALGDLSPGELEFDALLVDEGQDLTPRFLGFAEKLLTPDAEVMIAHDPAQRIYDRPSVFEDPEIARSFGRPVHLNGSFRMHARLCSLASELGKTTQPEMPEVVPDPDALRLWQTSRLAWIEAATDADSANAVARTLLGWREELGHDPSSVAILVASKVFGATLARLLDEIDVRTQHVFHVTAAAQDEEGGSVEERTRNRKRTFVPRDERSKVSTIHSFKGWEAERVIVVLGGGRSRSSWTARRLFVAITRASSELVVVGHEDSFGLRRLMPDAPPQPAGPVPNIAGRYEVVSRVVAAELRRPGSRNGSRPGPRAAPSGHA